MLIFPLIQLTWCFSIIINFQILMKFNPFFTALLLQSLFCQCYYLYGQCHNRTFRVISNFILFVFDDTKPDPLCSISTQCSDETHLVHYRISETRVDYMIEAHYSKREGLIKNGKECDAKMGPTWCSILHPTWN